MKQSTINEAIELLQKKWKSIWSYTGLVLLLAACSPGTKVTSSWVAGNPDRPLTSFNEVMVIALLPDKDRHLQQVMETNMVNELTAKGVKASSAYEVYGPKYFTKNEKQALRQLKNEGADGVMTITLLDKTKEKNYVPGNTIYPPIGLYYNRFWGYYSYMYDRIYSPGYYTTNTSYFWESNLYDLNGRKLIYSAQSESFDPASAASLSEEYSKRIMENMIKKGVVARIE